MEDRTNEVYNNFMSIKAIKGVRIPSALWDQVANRVKGSNPEARLINNELDKSKFKLRELYSTLTLQYDEVTAEMLRDAFMGKQERPKTLLYALDFVIEHF